MNQASMPRVGDKGIFVASGVSDGRKRPRATVIHVWSDTCVNLVTEDRQTPTSVFVYRGPAGGPDMPGGYFFVPDKLDAADCVEAEIQAKGLTAPRLTPADIEANITGIEYVKHVSLGGQVLRWAVITTRNGFAVTGRPSVAVSPENDDAGVGERVAKANAVNEMWPLMGYALKQTLHEGVSDSYVKAWRQCNGLDAPNAG